MPERPCRVVLIGMMGSGKTTIGRLLAPRTGWPYYDNDELLQGRAGETARALLANEGTSELREGEAAVLRAGLVMAAPCIVAAPAGTILDGDLRAALAEQALVVWLTAPPQSLAERATGSAHRPWLDKDPVGWMTRTLAQRAPLYKEVANLVVDTQGRQPEQVADEIATWLAGRQECVGHLGRHPE